MFNCANEITKFHDEEVRLSRRQSDDLHSKKVANRDRIQLGLADNGDPKPVGFWVQGSFAMKTVVQAENNHIDLDDGLYFHATDLKGRNGGDLSPRAVKEKVLAAVTDGRFTRKPEILTNCVRVYYNEGYNIDVPVYREVTTTNWAGNPETHYELASSEWKKSDPRAVTEWFNREVTEQSPDTTNGRQLRRLVRLMKDFVDSRSSWVEKMPSGFILSTLLLNECYRPDSARDDLSLYNTMKALRDRLTWNTEVNHPVLDEKLTKESDKTRLDFLREQLNTALADLQVLFKTDCDAETALKAWGKVFNAREFFEEQIPAAQSRGQKMEAFSAFGILAKPASEQTLTAVDKQGGGRYA